MVEAALPADGAGTGRVVGISGKHLAGRFDDPQAGVLGLGCASVYFHGSGLCLCSGEGLASQRSVLS